MTCFTTLRHAVMLRKKRERWLGPRLSPLLTPLLLAVILRCIVRSAVEVRATSLIPSLSESSARPIPDRRDCVVEGSTTSTGHTAL
mmetsp:Transcript_49051/g.126766  ORF Transcript_49051/g.126766 Transcript_49051/m.126766 type:complete len:86 (-) Transcript_49051:1236-1493(-)